MKATTITGSSLLPKMYISHTMKDTVERLNLSSGEEVFTREVKKILSDII